MIYTGILLVFGVLPLLALWFVARRWIGRYVGVLFWLTPMIVFVGAFWESVAIDRVWFYAPGTVIGIRLLNIPLEEWAYYVLYALLAATLVIVVITKVILRPAQDRLLVKAFTAHGVRRNV